MKSQKNTLAADKIQRIDIQLVRKVYVHRIGNAVHSAPDTEFTKGMGRIKHFIGSIAKGLLLASPWEYIVYRRRMRLETAVMEEAYWQNSHLREQRVPAQLAKVRERVAQGQPVRVAFLVYTRQIFPLRTVFEAMCQDPAFEATLVVIPCYDLGSMQETKRLFSETYEEFKEKYAGRVLPLDGYDLENKTSPDISDSFDICAYATPYSISTEYFNIEHLSRKCLCIYSEYGYAGINLYCIGLCRRSQRGLMWRIFADNALNVKMMGDSNAVLTGSCANDGFATAHRVPSARKRIILAPHHSIPGWSNAQLEISTFLTHCDFFLKLPKLYPQIDFIFRPHPILLSRLKEERHWGVERTDAWMKELLSNPNVIFNMAGDYTEIFGNSDAMIHDCCSFLADYFYTDKPQCYLLRKHVNYKRYLTDFGMEILQHTYTAKTQKQILHFIDHVVLNGKDPKKRKREAFAEAEIKIGYPHVHDAILQHLRVELGMDGH